MKRFLIYAAIAVLVASSASAQSMTKPLSLYLKGGVSLPQSDFETGFKMGYHGSAAVGLKFLQAVEAVACISYHSFSPDFPEDSDADGGRFTALLYGGEGKLNLGAPMANPFIVAGAGLARIQVTETEYGAAGNQATAPSQSMTRSYFTFGAGLEFERLFVEARYIKILDDIDMKNISTDVDEENTIVFIPVSVGLKF
ncbi:MAG: outer membrane beta-barrel protein [bacterium]